MTRPLAASELAVTRLYLDLKASGHGPRVVSLTMARELMATLDDALHRARAAEATVAELLTSPTPGR